MIICYHNQYTCTPCSSLVEGLFISGTCTVTATLIWYQQYYTLLNTTHVHIHVHRQTIHKYPHIHTQMHMNTYIQAHIKIHARMQAHTHMYTHAHACARTHTHTYTHTLTVSVCLMLCFITEVGMKPRGWLAIGGYSDVWIKCTYNSK